MHRLLFTLILLLLLCGCASQPTVYVYGKYLSDDQKRTIAQDLARNDYNVEVNALDFPTTISENTVLYSLMLQDPAVIDNVAAIAEETGMRVNRIEALTSGNHWYTKNSLALFLLPEQMDKPRGLFTQDLVHTYISEGCNTTLTLTLHDDGSYTLSGESVAGDYAQSAAGNWLYRQYPYIELRPTGAEFSNQYFEISLQHTRDQISPITFIILNPIQSPLVSETCTLQFGLRDSN